MSRPRAFTPEAARRWQALPGRTQTLLLNNVWCAHCGGSTTIVHYGGVGSVGSRL